MLLSDEDIRLVAASGLIDPFEPDHLNPASYDLTLHPTIRVVSTLRTSPLDVIEIEQGYTDPFEMDSDDGYVLEPFDFILASSVERVSVPVALVARVEGKSSLGRIGLAVHITAGFIDPGFTGQVTLEIVNLLGRAIRLRPGMRVAQIAFQRMASEPAHPYGEVGHYQGQAGGPVESRYRMPSRQGA